MRKTLRLAIVAVTLVTLVVLTVAASALAVTSFDTQSSPGVHQRTIWDSTQVMIQRLTKDGGPGVNHIGYIHLQLTFKPTTSDFDIYLLDANGDVLSAEMGCMGIFAGKEYVDYQVTDVANQNIVDVIDPYTLEWTEYMEGDVYYVVIVAFNGAADYQVWGYYPSIDLETSEDVYESYNYYLQSYRFPASSLDWAKLTGPRYGGPYDFRPTSAGTGSCALAWPADLASRTITYDPVNAPMPYNVEQYMYAGTYWDEVLSNWGTEENYLPDFWKGDTDETTDDWYGFNDEYEVATSVDEAYDPIWAQRLAHYVPSLYLAYADATLGPAGDVKTGRTTMGYKAVLRYPENLWLKKVTKYSTYYKVSGRYSLDGAAVPVGTEIDIQRKTATRGWATVKTVKTTDALGSWSAKVSPTVKWWVRAKAEGNPATGLEYEYSITKTLAAL